MNFTAEHSKIGEFFARKKRSWSKEEYFLSKNPLLQVLKAQYGLFSNLYKKTLRYLIWMFQNKIHVFPSKERIAKAIKGSVKTVGNALKLFKELGIIDWQNRGSRSNLYLMDDLFREIELEKMDEILTTFRDDCRSNCRLVEGVSKEDIDISVLPSANMTKSIDKGRVKKLMSYEDLPHLLKQPFMKAFDFANFGWQIKLLPEVAQQEIVAELKWYDQERRKRGNPVRDMAEWCKIFTWKMKKVIFKYQNLKENHGFSGRA